MADTRPVLLLTLAKGCGGCIALKEHILPSLEQHLQQDGRLRVVKIELPNMNRAIVPGMMKDNRVPEGLIPEIIPYIEWFPNLLIISGASWNRGRNLEVSTFNGKKTSKGWEGDQAIPVTRDNIIRWMNTQLKSQPAVPLVTLTQGNTLPPAPISSTVQPLLAPSERYVPTVGSINYRPRHF